MAARDGDGAALELLNEFTGQLREVFIHGISSSSLIRGSRLTTSCLGESDSIMGLLNPCCAFVVRCVARQYFASLGSGGL